MRIIKYFGLAIFIAAITFFTSLAFFGNFEVSEESLSKFVESKSIKSQFFIDRANKQILGKKYSTSYSLSQDILSIAEESHEYHRSKIKELENSNASKEKIDSEWGKVIWLSNTKKHSDFSLPLVIQSGTGFVTKYKLLLLFLTFGLGIIGSLMFILPNVILLGQPGIKNDNIYHQASTNRGWIAIIVFVYLITFYVLLYFLPDYIVNWIYVVDPVSNLLNGGDASQWFLYGMFYCTAMTVMAVRMFIKYRHNLYQIVRTAVVLFFQIAFAFLIPEILARFNKPAMDFKNAWPLNYSFFFEWNIDKMIDNGTLGVFMLVWGITLSLIVVPVLAYIYGKRWYCSWVCGCGGLAETLGDPYRQHSDKSLKAWRIERWLVHSVLVFATLMTGAVLYAYFTGAEKILGIATYDIQSWYGFLIGSIFAGVIGTGFYPIFGNRVWCRFGCPLAAYLGIVQRFKSRFRITTNGGQCISCGNCSTYCEQGIDVRAYAQRGENIIRASCVGCGICAAVCPRGVLKLENGPEEKRIIEMPPIVGTEMAGKEKNV